MFFPLKCPEGRFHNRKEKLFSFHDEDDILVMIGLYTSKCISATASSFYGRMHCQRQLIWLCTVANNALIICDTHNAADKTLISHALLAQLILHSRIKGQNMPAERIISRWMVLTRALCIRFEFYFAIFNLHDLKSVQFVYAVKFYLLKSIDCVTVVMLKYLDVLNLNATRPHSND